MDLVLMYYMFASESPIPDWAVQFAKDFTVLISFFAALGVLARYGPIRRPLGFVWRKLVAEPVGAWLHKLVSDAVHEELEALKEPPKE